MNNNLRKLFGSRVRELRKAAGLTQEEFADICGYARTYLSRIETGGANVSLDAIDVLASALGIEPSDLLVFSQPEISKQKMTPSLQFVELAPQESKTVNRRMFKGRARSKYPVLHDEVAPTGDTEPSKK
ncbi:helix-turn-helix domain-containing protein [Alcaligenes aquatilis]|uniref:helix-turn-helix domain-containing protein n=1 Tax=Alcaligenes aquatilis TaxID=323284 RepID=UPI003750474B